MGQDRLAPLLFKIVQKIIVNAMNIIIHLAIGRAEPKLLFVKQETDVVERTHITVLSRMVRVRLETVTAKT